MSVTECEKCGGLPCRCHPPYSIRVSSPGGVWNFATGDIEDYRISGPTTPTGWKCPSCGTVWAPSVRKCEDCS